MSKCDSKGFVVRSEQVGKLKNEDLIAISVQDALASCAKIDARTVNGDTTSGLTAPFYNAANVPVDAFGCSKNGCYNTGTFQGTVTAGEDVAVTIGDFKKTFDATLYATGIITAYVLLPDGDHTISLDITDYTEADWTNSETYTTTVHATKGNGGSALYPVRFDLSQTPAAETGTGWTPSTIGVKVKIGVTIDGGVLFGVSSIAFYESIEDLELNKTILLSCLDTFGDNQSFDVIEGACSTSEYDPQSGTMTFNLTANKFTENLRFINPTLRKTDDAEFGVLNIVTRKVQDASTIDAELTGYGFVQLSDMAEEECGFVYIQTPGCAGNSHDLTRVNSPIPTISKDTDADKFQVLTTEYKGDRSRGVILVSKDWINQDLNIIYRKAVTAEVFEVTNEFRDFNVSILAPLRKKDGTVEWHLYENAFVTAVPTNISRSDETTVELEFTVAADENGVRKKIAKILDN